MIMIPAYSDPGVSTHVDLRELEPKENHTWTMKTVIGSFGLNLEGLAPSKIPP